ncbi:MAG: dihydroorotase family protein [Treponema sp.]|nr:dihydroorotase family protein [Treponema sp.]
MRYDLIIKDGTIVTPEKTFKGDVAVKNGKIENLGNVKKTDTADEVYNAKGLHILPGIIDAHVHFRDPGLTEKEDFETGSLAAAMGGITMIADMPNVIPPTLSVEHLKNKINIASEKSYVDFAFFALLNNENTEQIEDLKLAGALGFKIFLGTSTGDIAAPSRVNLLRQMEECACLGMRIGFHCETSELNDYYTNMFKNRESYIGEAGILLNAARPVFSEALAIQTAICYAQYTKARIHIHHITSADGAKMTADAKKKGIDITAETCPHYLFLNAKKNVQKVYPPIRDEIHRIRLWEAVKNGVIDMIASDHAPHTIAEKSLPVWETPAGLCGVETSVPLMLNEINKGNLTLQKYVSLASEAPAKIWGIYPRKGNLFPGADGDITIVDMKQKKKILANELHSKSKTSPYDGTDVQGFPVATIIRGNFIMKDGCLTGKKGYGLHIIREL